MPDFFVSYNKADKKWADWIAWELEQAGYTTIVQTLDFLPGSNFILAMQNAAAECTRTLAVLSPDYLSSEFAQAEWAAAFSSDPTGKFRKLVPVRVRLCELRGLLKSIVYVDLVGTEEDVARRRLLDGMTGERRRTTRPRFPTIEPPRYPGTLPEIWNVPHLRNPHFTGRDDILNRVSAALTNGRTAAVTQAISGLGGIGKTQLAVEFAYRNASDYSVVWWVRAEEPATMASDYADLASKLRIRDDVQDDLPHVVAAVRDWLSHNDGWLLIVDNAQSAETCTPVIPYGGGGHIIITSRNTHWKAAGGQISIETLTRQESVQFLHLRVGRRNTRGTEALCEELGDLPLALEQAAAYIESSGITISQYLRLFRKHPKELLGPVATTWALSFSVLTAEAPSALELMNLFAFLAPEEIPRGIAKRIVGSDLALNEAVSALRKYSLISANRRGLTVHRLVQAAVRQRLSAIGQEVVWAERAVRGLYRLKTLAGTDRLLPHVMVAAAHAERVSVASEVTGELLSAVGLYLRDRGQLIPASEALERAIRSAEKAYGVGTPEVAAISDDLAQVLVQRGILGRALDLTKSALEAELRSFGSLSPKVANTVGNLGRILREIGELPDAIRYLRQALEIEHSAYGLNHPRIAVLNDELSAILHERGELDAALTHANRALDIDEAVYGPDHSQIGIDHNNIAAILRDTGNYPLARQHLQIAVSVFERLYGSEHPLSLQTATHLREIDGEHRSGK